MKDWKLRKILLRMGLALTLLIVAALVVWMRGLPLKINTENSSKKVIPATCLSGGYTLYTDLETGEVTMADIVPALGHSFSDWQTEAEFALLKAGSRSRSCVTCGATEHENIYQMQTIPVIALEGSLDGIGKKNEVPVQALFQSSERTFSSYATVKYQGHSSLHYPKKNFTLKFWKDAQANEKDKLTFSHWNAENKYILKADYIDPTMCRNLICANVWAAVTENRENRPVEFTELSNYGAVDGFPAALYINGTFEGLYNMNLHKDDDLFGMSDGAEHAIMIVNDPNGPEAFFKGEAVFGESSAWEVEFCGTENTDWAKQKLNELITFVMESDDETFRRELSDYLDVNSAIDYLLSIYVLGLTNHGADELILVCYGSDMPWVASMYDMETGFGLSADGKQFLSAEEFLPVLTDGVWVSGTQNLLWDRLLQNFTPQIASRYQALRQSVFTPEALKARVTDFTGAIPRSLYEANDAVCQGYPESAVGIAQILRYIDERIQMTDELFLNK